MLKVLLVDDEPYVLEGLSTMVDWAAYGFSVYTAANGEDALEIVRESDPDLVITDIRMPGMNGIEFIKLSIERYHANAEFVILSGYDDFSYAKEAMRYHVCDYLLKPLDDEELDRLISRMAAKICKKRAKADTDRRQLSYIANQSINRLIKGEMKESLQKRIRALLDMDDSERVRCVLIDCESGAVKADGGAKNLIEKKLGMPFHRHLFEDDMGRFGIIVTEKMSVASALEAFVKELLCEIKERNGGSPTAAVSLPGKGPRSFPVIYRQALYALNYRFYDGRNDIILYRDVGDQDMKRDLCTEDFHTLLESVRLGDGQKAEAILDQLFDHFSQNPRAPGSIVAYLRCFDLELIRLIMDMDGDPDHFSRTTLKLHQEMDHLTMDELKDSFLAHCRRASVYLETIRQSHPHSIVNEIKNYIKENYRNNIKLKSIAKVFYMNPIYLGQIFIRTTGMHFTDYLNTIRIEEAKKLLRRSDMQIQEIARAVGFQNAKYFSNKFKLATNLAPSTFRDTV